EYTLPWRRRSELTKGLPGEDRADHHVIGQLAHSRSGHQTIVGRARAASYLLRLWNHPALRFRWLTISGCGKVPRHRHQHIRWAQRWQSENPVNRSLLS